MPSGLGHRRSKRIPAALVLRLWRMDVNGKPFMEVLETMQNLNAKDHKKVMTAGCISHNVATCGVPLCCGCSKSSNGSPKTLIGMGCTKSPPWLVSSRKPCLLEVRLDIATIGARVAVDGRRHDHARGGV